MLNTSMYIYTTVQESTTGSHLRNCNNMCIWLCPPPPPPPPPRLTVDLEPIHHQTIQVLAHCSVSCYWQTLLHANAPLPDNTTDLLQRELANLSCQEQFSRVNGICIPRCDSWEQTSHTAAVTVQVTLMLAASLLIIGGIAVFIASCIWWKNM